MHTPATIAGASRVAGLATKPGITRWKVTPSNQPFFARKIKLFTPAAASAYSSMQCRLSQSSVWRCIACSGQRHRWAFGKLERLELDQFEDRLQAVIITRRIVIAPVDQQERRTGRLAATPSSQAFLARAAEVGSSISTWNRLVSRPNSAAARPARL